MERLKKALDRFFIDGLSAMAHGLFATLIIGTIIQQIGTLIGGPAGDMIYALGKVAASLTGAGIGAAVAYKFKESPLVVVSASAAGMIGAFASNLLSGTVLAEGGAMVYRRAGGTAGRISGRLHRHLFRTPGVRPYKDRYSGDASGFHRHRRSSRTDPGTAHFRFHGLAGVSDQLGH